MVITHSQTSPTQTLGGNESFPLVTPQMWQVTKGSLGIFAVRWKQNEPVGERRYLFTVQAGEGILGSEPLASGLGLVAVAFESSTLDAISLLSEAKVGGGSQFIDPWIHQCSRVRGFPTMPILERSTAEQHLELHPGNHYAPTSLVWITTTLAPVNWLGLERFSLDPKAPPFPLTPDGWISTEKTVELQLASTTQLLEDATSGSKQKTLLDGLTQFHRYVLQVIETGWQTDLQKGEQQFTARQQLNQEITQTTLQGLASLLKPNAEEYLLAETPLLVATGAVGHVLGVTIQPPAESEKSQRMQEPLDAIARASQLRLRQVLLRGRWWDKEAGPLVAYTRTNRHPVALLPAKNNQYELLDPQELGTRPKVTEAVAQTLDPVAFMFYRPLPQEKIQALDLLKFAFHGRGRDLWMVGLTGLVATLLGMVLPQMTAVLVDDAIPFGSSGLLVQIGLALVAVAFGRASFQLVQAIAAMRLETGSDATLQAAIWDRLLKLQTSFFRNYATGDLLSRVSSITTIRSKLSGTALNAILSGTFALLNLGLLFYYSAKLATVALVVALLMMAVTVSSGVLLLKKQRPLLELSGELYGLMVQLINGVSKLRLAAAESRAFAQWGEKYRQLLQLETSTQRLEDGVNVFNTVMPTLTTIALFWVASGLVGQLGLSTGRFLAFNAAFAIFISGATSLSLTMIEVLDIIPLWSRSQPILQAEPEVTTDKTDPGQLAGAFCLDHATFRYRDDGPLILDDVTVQAKPGEFIALVGPSGSGKSTVLRLLLGFEQPHSGTVYFDGQALCGLDVTAVRRQLGVVLQNGRINAGSIFENISGGALISLDDAWRAAEMAGFSEDIHSFPMQMHTIISEGGSNLSGGQRQRLIIARALALNPKLLLLDEATSALDNKTQTIVSESLDRLKVTRVVVAHRLSTIRHADRIYVIKAGRVEQVGTFDELAQQPGVFAELIQRQVA